MKPIRTHIITGFLGAGKTSAIIQLFRQKPAQENWAIVINEFGKVAIDRMILQDYMDDSSTIREVIGGCICCSSRDYFQEHIQEIIKQKAPDRIIIEPTGLGRVRELRNVLETFPSLQMEPVICLVDVNSYDNSHFRNNPIYLQQINDADAIVISKCDSDSHTELSDALIHWIKNTYAEKLCYRKCTRGNVGIELLNLPAKPAGGKPFAADFTNLALADKNKIYTQQAYSWPADRIFNMERVQRLLGDLTSVIRAKGYLNTAQGWMLFQAVMQQFTVEPATEKTCNELVVIWKDPSMVQPLEDLLQKNE